MDTKTPSPAIALTDPPAVPRDDRCPSCRAGKDRRVASGGFGQPHPVCGQCGYEWHGEEWHG